MTTQYPHTDKIKAVLKDKADFVQRDGLNYLIPNWQRFASKYADTEDLIYDWLNDLDTRRIIGEILSTLSDTDRATIEQDLKIIDAEVIEKTFEINECVWGDKVERDNKYNRQKNWYESESGQITKR